MNKLLWHLRFWLFFAKCKLQGNRTKTTTLNLSADEKVRVDYYCKLKNHFSLNEYATLDKISLKDNSGYSYDLFRVLWGLGNNIQFTVLYGDVIHVPSQPTFVKSRPIAANNENSVLLPLNTYRHLQFVEDAHSYVEKIPKIVWRGAAYRETRKKFLAAVEGFDFCDVRDTSRHAAGGPNANWLTKEQQLMFKFIFSIEGNDVATNLKWIMSSNSLCFMPTPKYETWFMEGTLIPDHHYVCIKDDFSDVKEKYNYYMSHPEEAEIIIANAQKFVNQFRDIDCQFRLAKAVVHKYQSLLSASQ